MPLEKNKSFSRRIRRRRNPEESPILTARNRKVKKNSRKFGKRPKKPEIALVFALFSPLHRLRFAPLLINNEKTPIKERRFQSVARRRRLPALFSKNQTHFYR
jgi:hypothetical protein